MPEYEMRPYRPGDEESILHTFNEVFAKLDPQFRERSREDWEWVNTRNPHGMRTFVAMYGDLVAAYACVQPHRSIFEGREAFMCQKVDSMVHPDHRRGLKRPGLFVALCRHMYAERDPRDIGLYGWPLPEAWRIGNTFLDYRMARMQTAMFLPVGPGPEDLPQGVETVERFDDEVLELYERCRTEWGLSAVRDATFLNWRFFECPRRSYEPLLFRDGAGVLRGMAVFGAGDWPAPDSGVVMDWLVPLDEPAAADALHAALEARARAAGARQLYAHFPEWTGWFARFQERGWMVGGSDYLLSTVAFVPQVDVYYLRDRWWYTFADMELF